MPRKLPWLQAGDSRSGASPPKRARRREVTSFNEDDELEIEVPTRIRKGKLQAREPSSSPPPSLPPPLAVEYMKEGPLEDDRWIMVEDEFAATAAVFTRHLHHAEYKRLKERAKSNNTAAINDIAQPPDSRYQLSNESKKRKEAAALSAKQQRILGRPVESDESDGDPWSQNNTLTDLISQPRELSSRLASVVGVQSKTRAAAGYLKAPANNPQSSTTGFSLSTVDVVVHNAPILEKGAAKVSEDDDGDLDTPFSLRALPERPKDFQYLPSTSSSSLHEGNGPLDNEAAATREPSKNVQNAAAAAARSKLDASTDFPPRRAMPTAFAERIAKRRADAVKREQKSKPKSVSLDQIPTFLI